jgi:hypothetical protein
MRLLAFLLATTGLLAGSPVKVTIDSAQVTLGPGREPQPGAAPFQARLEARFSLQGPSKGAHFEYRFWRAQGSVLAGLRRGQAIHSGTAGFLPLNGEVTPLDPGRSFQLSARTQEPWNGPESLVVEVISRGRLSARGTLAILERNLPTALPHDGMKP